MSDEYKAWLAALKPGDEVAIRGLGDGLITSVRRIFPETPSLRGTVVIRSGWEFDAATGEGTVSGTKIGPPTARDRMIAKHIDLQKEIQHAWNGSAALGEELPDAELAEMVSRMERALAVLRGR
jgi:hypothetical protein